MDETNLNTAVGSAFTEELARLGVDLAVVSPGSRSTPLALALEREPAIEVEVVLDERSAGFFALGAAQATARPVVLLCTSGSAAANYLPAVVEADLSAVPLIVLTADRPPELRGVGSGQAIDQLKLFGDAVRWFVEVGTPAGDDEGLLFTRQLACRAWAAAAGDPRPGPVQLNFPFREPLAPRQVEGAVTAETDLAREGRSSEPLTSVSRPVRVPSPDGLAAALSFLDGGTRTMIVAGRLPDADSREAVVRLSDVLGAPILAEPTSQLRWGPHDRSAIIWGYDLLLAGDGAELPPPPETIIRIGETPTSSRLRRWIGDLDETDQIVIRPEGDWYDPSRKAHLILRSDLAPTLDAIAEGFDGPAGTEYRDAWLAAQSGLDPSSPASAIHRTIAGAAPEGSIIYTASSLAIREQETFLDTADSDLRYLANRGTNGIDGLVASAAGAALGSGKPVVAVTGDLGLIHDAGSLPLATRAGVDLKVVVINDGGGRIFETLPAHDLLQPDEFERLMLAPSDLSFEKLAAVAGVPWIEAGDPAQLESALTGAGSRLIEYRLDRDA